MTALSLSGRADKREPTLLKSDTDREIRSLNSLRGLAALIVLVSHYSNRAKIFHGVLGQGSGQLGVMLFFILSGFLMSHLYLNKEFTKTNVKKYLVARIARVVPLFMIVVFASFTLRRLNVGGDVVYDINSLGLLLSHVFMLSGISVLWTIPPEVQFYILFVPFWYLYWSGRMRLLFVIVAIFVVEILLGFPDRGYDVDGLRIETKLLVAIPFFLTGLLLGQLFKHWNHEHTRKNSYYILTLLFIPLLYPRVFANLFGHEHGMFKDLGVLLIISVVFFCCVFLVPDSNPLLANGLGDYLGKISYSLYLLHIPVLKVLDSFIVSYPMPGLPVFILAAILVATVSYYLLELPSRKLIRSVC